MTQQQRWNTDRIPDQSQRVVVVTGAGSGLGLATSLALARRGAQVVLAVRDVDKGRAAAATITAAHPGARLDVRRLDLADLESVQAFTDGLRADHPRIDVLVNNAGVMAPPHTLSAQGHELQFATNHLGHFALTGLLLEPLAQAPDARVVTVSSLEHRKARLDLDDLSGQRGYSPMGSYRRSKLANAVFGIELQRRLTAAALPVRSLLAHPGYSATGLQTNGTVALPRLLFGYLARPLAQSAAAGALPQLYAATAPGLGGGEFIGPDGKGEMKGAPTRVEPAQAAVDAAAGRRLWEVSQELTKVRFALPDLTES
ncbi:SDR family NAD(P)-dependent oxidoreductase [Streptomyces sp. SID14478]|uniref:oxidoreductase n=1 Tax=Streptomyces sp. SID14478 TaxID=2706073 RepID=UPI0013DCCFBA|nr:oxidoreductase [Streptomyces sp. SID14478]NEB78840.1 SDR family NAD(P)-dependent oxidoreductase [Streptomyces sp. SID14478]